MHARDPIGPLAVLALRQSPISALHNLEVTASEDRIILSGRVGSYYYKQLAQETVGTVAGNRAIINNIRVLKPVRSV
jgi:osmotically-inducible protein OsmY